MRIVVLYAALLTLLYLILTFRIIFLRGKLRAPLGDAGDRALQRAIRAHANFAEYVPLALLLMLMAAGSGATSTLLHGLGGALLLGRLLHAGGVSQVREPLPMRIAGMVLTTGCLFASAGYLLRFYFLSSAG